MADKIISLAEAKQCAATSGSHILADMIRDGSPLSRDYYIQMSFGSFDNWDHEKESSLPDCFQDEQACAEMIADSSHNEEQD